MSKQPIWKLVAQLGDADPIEHGGYFIYEDTTGVYPPEAAHLIAPEDDDGTWIEYRFILEPCTWIDGILSDNKFHPGHAAWFAENIESVASCSGQPEVSAFISSLTGDSITDRAWAWRAIGEYHGFENLDSYPNSFTREEIEARYPRATWKV
jgi:hypothetical protein